MKEEKVVVRMTKEEKEVIARKAKEAGIPMSLLVRAKILDLLKEEKK